MAERAMSRRGGIAAILGTADRDFLVRYSGEQVKISSIEATTVALYFSASWCPPCRLFTPKLIETYQELQQQDKSSSLEVVYIPRDRDEASFTAYFAKMPWLAVPFSSGAGDSAADFVAQLVSRFKVNGIPCLVILDARTGEIFTRDGVRLVADHGAAASPFTPARIAELREQERAARESQTIHSVLATPDRDYLLSSAAAGGEGGKVPISELEGKHVALLFVMRPAAATTREFTAALAGVYEKLRENGERFEVVAVFFRCDEAAFRESFFGTMPWLSVPHGDAICERLVRYFELKTLPTLVLLGPDGKTLKSNVADVVEEHGVDACEGFPFTDEKMQVLVSRSKAKAATQTLESLLVSGDLDYVVGKDGAKVPVSELVDKTVMLYFSAKWYAPCGAFLPTLVEVYTKIKEKTSDFEVVFVSMDRDQSAYEEHLSGMPWLALPLEDERKQPLMKKLRVSRILTLVAVGVSGATLTADAAPHVLAHGAAAFPFTEDVLAELGRRLDEEAAAWPRNVRHEMHEVHELALTRRDAATVAAGVYTCDGCEGLGGLWSYRCDRCDFELHPKCALRKEEEEEEEEEAMAAAAAANGCAGGVCTKA